MEEKEVYSVNEASELLGVLPATIRKHIHDGKMVATQYFGRWIIPRSEIERYQSQLRKIGIDASKLNK